MSALRFSAPDLSDGARLRSLCGAGREWLHPADGERTTSDFIASSLGGWDEMLPTITPCRVPHEAGSDDWGDHGDAWNRPWSGTADDHWVDVAWMRLRRRIVHDATGIRLDYTLSSTATEPRHVQWVAHPQFSWESGTTLELGDPAPWLPVHPSGEVRELGAIVDPRSLLDHDGGAKWWSSTPIDRVVLRRGDGTGLRVTWDAVAVRGVALWIDPGTYASAPVIAIEPALAPHDSLADAVSTGTAPTVSRDRPLRWWMRLEELG